MAGTVYLLCKVDHQDESLELVEQYTGLVKAMEAGQSGVEQDENVTLALYTDDMTRVARWGWGRLGYSQWLQRKANGQLHAQLDKWEKDEDELVVSSR
jgi:hypothetical protein